MSILFFGITERFESSLCLFTWMYGGTISKNHTKIFRKGNYTHKTINEALSLQEQTIFNNSEKFDLELYTFALKVFENRYSLTTCPPSISRDDSREHGVDSFLLWNTKKCIYFISSVLPHTSWLKEVHQLCKRTRMANICYKLSNKNCC